MAADANLYVLVGAGFVQTRAMRALRRELGMAGQGRYLSLLCMVLNESGHELDVSDDRGWDDLADELGTSADECRSLVALLGREGMADQGALGDGRLRLAVVDAAIAEREAFVEAKRRAGIASGQARRRKRDGEE